LAPGAAKVVLAGERAIVLVWPATGRTGGGHL